MGKIKNGRANLNLINPAEIKEGIKAGLGVKYFCDKYDCTEKQLSQRISAVFGKSPRITRQIVADLRSNDKKLAKKTTRASKAESAVGDEEEAKKITEEVAEEVIEAVNLTPPHSLTTAEQIAELQTSEKLLSDEVMDLESRHKNLAQEHRDCIKKLRTLKGDIEEIKATFRAKCREYEDIVLKNNTLVSQMNAISRDRYGKVTELSGVRQMIEELSKISICVYADGTIASIDDQPSELDETGSDELYTVLIEDDRCQNLRLKSIKILARLIRIVKNSSHQVELLFDDAELESVFYAFNNSSAV